ncbi:MAG: N-acetyltransferase [Robiginitomaculum sp.]|nr:N-acetyltransferase [Robiginitomaculum sp.]
MVCSRLPNPNTPSLQLRILQKLDEIDAGQWDALANPPGAPFDPFICYAFLHALEQSGGVGAETGWVPVHLVAENMDGTIVGFMPLYLKNHSMGEYVFDHGWAGAYEQAGGQYYPKLQSSIPFTPAAGPRILAQDQPTKRALIAGLENCVTRFGASSAHITFTNEPDAKALTAAKWMKRDGLQFHFYNPGYDTYENFLETLTARKRKALRRERKKANDGVQIVHLCADEITPEHWDAFYGFYLDTGARKWGVAYLNRTFFDLISQTMKEHILLVMAKRDGNWIAGALHFIGGDCLYGRYWGCVEFQDSLHFELCYHRAIEEAINRKLSRVEAGAQGAHKIARGYVPVITHSFHYLAEASFADAVQRFLDEETRAVKYEQAAYATQSPYRNPTA